MQLVLSQGTPPRVTHIAPDAEFRVVPRLWKHREDPKQLPDPLWQVGRGPLTLKWKELAGDPLEPYCSLFVRLLE